MNEQPQIIYRVLTISDAKAFKALRLKALSGPDGRFFAADKGSEEGRSIKEWKEACRETNDKAAFGTFINGQLVAILTAQLWKDDPTGNTVYYRSAYALPQYRGEAAKQKGMNVIAELYNLREKWAYHHHFTNAAFSIRYDNYAWLKAQLRRGAKILRKETQLYVDGEDALTYVLTRPVQFFSDGVRSTKAKRTKRSRHTSPPLLTKAA